MHNVSKKQSVGRGRSRHPQPNFKAHRGCHCVRYLLLPHPSGRLLAAVRKDTTACHRGAGRRGHHFLSRVQMEKAS